MIETAEPRTLLPHWPASLRMGQIRFASAILLGLSIFSAVLAGGFTIGYWFKANEAAETAGRQLFLQRQAGIASRLTALFEGPQFLASGLGGAQMMKMGHPAEAVSMLLAAHEFYPSIVNIKIGLENGLYFSVSRIAEKPDTRYYTPPPGAAYAVITVRPNSEGTFTQIAEFRDRNLVAMDATSQTPSLTDVRKLDWYVIGRESIGRSTWIGRVVPGDVGARISFLNGYDGNVSGVVGIDIGHRDIAKVLAEVRGNANEHLVVFDEQGVRYGSTTADFREEMPGTISENQTEEIIDDAIFARFKQAGEFTGQNIQAAGTTFFSSVMPIELRGDLGVSLYAGIAASRAHLEKPMKENLLGVLSLILATLALATPFVLVLSRKLAEPLRDLRELAEETLNLNFTTTSRINSMILEFRELTASFQRAQAAFRNICRFVPEAHVKRTISSGSATVFGERRTVSLLMTDVTGFTTMVEQMPPEQLLRDMTEYFDRLNAAILQEKGTIDKYVGDAIFSYWNGVVDEPRHAELCCRAGLRLRRASIHLAKQWQAKGKPPWTTRVGLHCGDVIVGNIGSEKRMDFTVIGNAVNLASRVEGLNKLYGTDILATDEIRRMCEDKFVFRSMDQIRPKGIHAVITIHELMAVRQDRELEPQATPELLDYCRKWEKAQELYRAHGWAAALAAFQALLQERPMDLAAQVYVARCEKFTITPPPGDWDGIERLDQK